jgi:hypothetical protein
MKRGKGFPLEYEKGCRRVRAAVSAAVLVFIIASSAASYAAERGEAGRKDVAAVEDGGFFVDEPDRKDPFIAGVLSWVWPGLGQFYTQDYGAGSLFLLADLVQKGLLIYGAFYYSDKYSSSGNEVVRWQDMKNRDQTIIIGYVFSVLFLKVYCVVDAVYSAERYNREVYFPYWKSQNKARFSLDVSRDGVNVAVTRPLQF